MGTPYLDIKVKYAMFLVSLMSDSMLNLCNWVNSVYNILWHHTMLLQVLIKYFIHVSTTTKICDVNMQHEF